MSTATSTPKASSTFVSLIKQWFQKMLLHFLYSCMSESMRRAFVLSSLFSNATGMNAVHDAEMYRKLNQLFNLSGSESTLLYPSSYAPPIWQEGTKHKLMRAVHEPENEEKLCEEIARTIPHQLQYADGKQVPKMDIMHLVEYIREKNILTPV